MPNKPLTEWDKQVLEAASGHPGASRKDISSNVKRLMAKRFEKWRKIVTRPISGTLGYAAIVRKILQVDELPQRILPKYEKIGKRREEK